MAFSLGFTLGPMLGASLPAHMAPWLALLFAASDLLFILCFLPETLPPEKRVSTGVLPACSLQDWDHSLLRIPRSPRLPP